MESLRYIGRGGSSRLCRGIAAQVNFKIIPSAFQIQKSFFVKIPPNYKRRNTTAILIIITIIKATVIRQKNNNSLKKGRIIRLVVVALVLGLVAEPL